MKKITIAIDGPAGSGKTTTAKIVADDLDYLYLDTGAMYRAVTLAALRNKTEASEAATMKLLGSIKVRLEQSSSGQITYLNDEDVSKEIRDPLVTKWVSPVSAMGSVREAMVDLQREIGKNGGIVVDGRDIGTTVFPKAELKIFLIATPDERAKRRAKELKAAGKEFEIDEIKQQIIDRDKYDSSRKISPLKKADDAIELDTTSLSIEEQSRIIIEKAKVIINN
jgi:cytidylate kinase